METTLTQESKSFNPVVASHGYGDAQIFFLGGHPSSEDISNGMSLSGYQESSLSSFLRAEHLNMKMCYRSTFIKEKLEYNGNNPKKLGQALAKIDIQKYLEVLYDELKSINPNIVVPLDDLSLSAVFPHINQIKKPKGRPYWIYCYRGSVLPLRSDFQSNLPDTIRVIPTLGPAILNADFTARAYTQIDFARIKESQNKRGPIEEYGKIWIARTYQQLSTFLERGFTKNDGFVTNDIETFGGLITCMSFCFDGYEAVSVPLSPFYYPEISRGEMALLWQLCARAVASKLPKCGQNFKYDFTIEERHGFKVNEVLHDTMLKHSLLYPELPKALDFQTSIYTPMAYYKDEGKNFNPQQDNKDRILLYNAKDSLATHLCNVAQDKELEETGQKHLYYNEIAPLIIIYKDMDEMGIMVDDEVKHKLLYKYTSLYQQNLSILRGIIGNNGFNPNSPKQVGALIYDELKFPKRTKTNEKGQRVYKTDKDTLDELLINFGDQNKKGDLGAKIISRVIVCRKLSMVLVCINTPLHPDGAFHGVFNLAGTETGRTSCSKSLDEMFLTPDEIVQRKRDGKEYITTQRLGRSLQTISKHGFQVDDDFFDDPDAIEIASDLRSMFVPRRGYTFVEGDGSQAEARFVAVLAEDWDLLDSFDKKPKLHAKTAALCFDIPVESIVKDEYGHWTPSLPIIGIAYYDLGKRIRHAGNYDMGAFRLSQMTHMPLRLARDVLEKFHATNPKIRGVFHNEVNQHIQKYRSLTTPFGRKRDFFDRFSDHLYKQAKAQVPQSTISDQTKFTLHRVKDDLDGYYERYRFLTEQHDGVLSEVQTDYAMEYAECFKKHYERTIDCRKGSLSRDFDLKIPCELSMSSENWQNLKDVNL